MKTAVRIFQLGREWDYWTWLCHKCLKARKALGWQVRERRVVDWPLTCDDCPRETP